jgi:dsDNA-binding SOS-regulon protein
MKKLLSFDGHGINGPSPGRERVATFTDARRADAWGPLLERAPDLRDALSAVLLALGEEALRSHYAAVEARTLLFELAREEVRRGSVDNRSTPV